MRLFRYYTPLPEDARGAVVALGNFDGVHLGHRAVIGAAGTLAREQGVPQGVLSFEPHPREFFRPGEPSFRLTPFRAKANRIAELGVDLLFNLHFDSVLSSMPAADFIDDVLVGGLAIRHLVVGWDFVFGHGRTGHADTLAAAGREKGFGVTVIEPVRNDAVPGDVISSTLIRGLLGAGEVRTAARLLGAPWEIDGRVEHGDRRGRTIGFPTANVAMTGYLRPRAGVYAVRAGIEIAEAGGRQLRWYDGVANIGDRPTVGGTDFRLEAHLFDFSGDIYDRQIRVQIIDWVRPEMKFPGLPALQAQIARDSETARALLATTAAPE
jgi:riboflavin kinase/FMN adenylyltransferase